MEIYRFENLQVTLNKQGATQYTQVTYPVRHGCYSEIETEDFIFQFNLNGEIKYIRGRHDNWPDQNEWLKRTIANDWIYYASGGSYNRIFSLLGEYYLPCFSYPTNTIFQQEPFWEALLPNALDALSRLQEKTRKIGPNVNELRLKTFLERVSDNDTAALALRRQQFYSLLGGQISVLPPDTRYVDYNVIPVIVADGCLYNCGFCQVKSGQSFRLCSDRQIASQIEGLTAFLGRERSNFNAVFLGQHDGLHAGEEVIELAARKACEELELDRSNLRGCYLFLFGSVDSVIRARESLFSMLNSLPYYTYINIGLESFDQDTLTLLKKPVRACAVEEAFARMQALNHRYPNIEMTGNLVLGCDLPPGHEASIIEQARDRLDRYYSKGALYFSPLYGRVKRRQIKNQFYHIKNSSRLPAYLYLIQRL
jgi:hypothetical protein